ncbi:MAG: molybdenum cofactor guanylyltransferase MobA [Pseudomonadota bacterium]
MTKPLTPYPSLTGLILAGGAGRRVQGADKAWLNWQGRPLIEQIEARLAPQVQQLWISANRDPASYTELLGNRLAGIIGDDWPDYPGPLAGIASCLPLLPSGWVLITPVDTPQLPTDLGEQLWQGLVTSNSNSRMAVAGMSDDTHWLHMLVHTDLAAGLRQRLLAGERRVRDWCKAEQAVRVLIAAAPDSFANLNQSSDY